MRKNSFAGPLAFMAAVAVAGWLYFTPHLALRRLQAAAESGDHAALREMVDFPAVRASLKEEVRGAIAHEMERDGKRSPFSMFGAALAGMMVDPLVDSFVTPAGIAAATRGERPRSDGEKEGVKKAEDDVEIARGYEGANRFVVHFRDRDDGGERIALVMARDGVAGWKLTSIRLGARE